MSLSQRLQPNNTHAARSTVQNEFLRHIQEESMSLDEVHKSTQNSADGRGLATIMDKFAIFLAFGDSSRGTRLATNTVNSYYGNVKLWLLGLYPALRSVAEPALQIVGTRLSKYCKKRSGGVIVKKAPACLRVELKAMLSCVYAYSTTVSDYLDGLLLNRLWYLFGRSSDLAGVQVRNIDIYPGGALCLRFTRHKTADESALTLFRDQSTIVTCPINALAVALVMKTSKEDKLFIQLPPALDLGDDHDLLSISLRDLLDRDRVNGVGLQAEPLARVPGLASPSVHGYVNRLLSTRFKKGGFTTKDLSSHSFRRGGAQHANGSSELSPKWILDRGSWSMSATNKGFVYVMNTTQEDQQVAKYLSGWQPRALIKHVDLSHFDGVVQTKIEEVADVLFSGCEDLNPHVRDVMMATIIQDFPSMVKLQVAENVGYVARVRQCLKFCNVLDSEFLSWHTFFVSLHEPASTMVNVPSAEIEPIA